MKQERIKQLYNNHLTQPHKTLFDIYKKPSYNKQYAWERLTRQFASITTVNGSCHTFTATGIDSNHFYIFTAYNTYKYTLDFCNNL